jgi:hypothetical protein
LLVKTPESVRVDIHGYAIVSADDRIADADGGFPEALKSDADWRYFQAELDAADLSLLGRVSHAAAPNPRGRRRLVVSGQGAGLVERADAWWWNPADLPFAAVMARLLPAGGRVAVPGGQGVFDLVRAGPGFTAFHLTRKAAVTLPGGRGLFAAVEHGTPAETTLAADGLAPHLPTVLEPGVVLTVWRR